MRLSFSKMQIELRDGVRAALSAACPPSLVRETQQAPPEDLWRQLAELGVLGINAPEEVGGLGMGAVDWVLLLEECGRFCVPAPVIEAVAANPLLIEAGHSDLAAQVASGEAQIAIAYQGGFASEADRAALVLLVEGDEVYSIAAPKLTPQPSIDGSRRLFQVEGERTLLEGDAVALAQRATLACSAQLLGLGHAILDRAIAYSKIRHQFGKPIGSFQAIQHHLVDATLKLRFAEPMVYRAAHSLDDAHPERALHISMAKIYATEAAHLACRKALQVHGAIGYTHELDLHLWMKRAWSLGAAWGDVAWHSERAAKALLGPP